MTILIEECTISATIKVELELEMSSIPSINQTLLGEWEEQDRVQVDKA
jgi:hypothetical protein